MNCRVVGVTGGIGSGKSVVCRVCALRGIPVYDCDSRAKALMDASAPLKEFLRTEIDADTVGADGAICRPALARRIFASPELKGRIEARVHAMVRDDIRSWLASLSAPVALVESAILHTSGLDAMCDAIWLVTAPEEVRVARAAARSGIPETDVRARVRAQSREFEALPPSKLHIIENNPDTPLLPRIIELLNHA